MVGVRATGASQSRAAHRKAQVPGGYPVLAVGVIVSIKSKIVCAVPSASDPRNLTLCGRRRATGKGKGCVLSSTKINLLFRITVIFLRENVLIFQLCKQMDKNTGAFFRSAPCFSHRPPPFRFLPPCFAHSSSTPLLGAPSRMTHARVSAHPRLAHSASFTFLPSPITCNLLNYCSLGVKAFAFPLSAPEGEGSSPKPSPSKCCRSTICAHRVKR